MKIKEGFLWKCYLRSYRSGEETKPYSICDFFWRALFGILLKIYDSTKLVVCLLVIGCIIGGISWIEYNKNGSTIHFLIGSAILASFSSLLLSMKGVEWVWKKFVASFTNDEVRIAIIWFAIFSLVVYSLLFLKWKFDNGLDFPLWLTIFIPIICILIAMLPILVLYAIVLISNNLCFPIESPEIKRKK